MKKIYLIVTLFTAILFLENCKKDTVTATAVSTALLFADINDTTWNPTTITFGINYNQAKQTKTFAVSGIDANEASKQINFSITLPSTANSAGFPIGTYNVDAAGTVLMSYALPRGNTYMPQGMVLPGSGSIFITEVDSVKKLITGTFQFTTTQKNVDGDGNVVSTTINAITQGTFNRTAYTFSTN
jgi:hypothetical protein